MIQFDKRGWVAKEAITFVAVYEGALYFYTGTRSLGTGTVVHNDFHESFCSSLGIPFNKVKGEIARADINES